MDELVSRRARASKRGDAGASVQGFDAERGVLALVERYCHNKAVIRR
jgi:hypothetical protein